MDSTIILEEEADRIGLSLPPYYDSGGRLGGATILVWGTEEQKQAMLPPIYTGEVRTWQLLTEPGAGSDLAGVQTTAIRDGDEYVINGQKIFVGSDHGADRIWMIAVTNPGAKRHENVSWFMIDAIIGQQAVTAIGRHLARPGFRLLVRGLATPAEHRVLQVHLRQQCLRGPLRRPADVAGRVRALRREHARGRGQVGDDRLIAFGDGRLLHARILQPLGLAQVQWHPPVESDQVEVVQGAQEPGLRHDPVAQGGIHVDARHVVDHRIGAVDGMVGRPPDAC